MFSGATSFNSDLSGWDVSKGKKFVSFILGSFLCLFPFLVPCSLAHFLLLYIDNFHCLLYNQINVLCIDWNVF